MNFANRFALIVIAALLGVVVPFYWYRLVRTDVAIEYYSVGDFKAEIGQTVLSDDLTIDISNVKFKSRPYSSVRIVQFLLVNNEARSVEAPVRFMFVTDSGPRLGIDSVLDIQLKSLLASSDTVLWERRDSPKNEPGLELLSDLPGNSRVVATLILDPAADVRAANASIQMRKVTRSGEFFERVSPFAGTITFTPTTLLLWLVGTAATWGLSWCLVNIVLGNYSTGARMIFWLLARIKAETLIPKDYKKRKQRKQ